MHKKEYVQKYCTTTYYDKNFFYYHCTWSIQNKFSTLLTLLAMLISLKQMFYVPFANAMHNNIHP